LERANNTAGLERGGGIGLVAERIQAERRWLHIMRSAAVIVAASWVLLLSWVVPVGPFAWDLSDYGATLAIGVILALFAGLSSTLFFFIWRPTLRGLSVREFVDVLLGADLLILRPSQFRRRLESACRRHADAFLVLIEFPAGVGEFRRRNGTHQERPALAALTVRSIARTEDAVADVSNKEVWVLADGDDGEHGEAILRRLAGVFAQRSSAMPELADARLGLAGTGNGAGNAQALFDSARGKAVPVGQLLAPAKAA